MSMRTQQLDVSAGLKLAKAVLTAYEQRRGVFEDTSDLLEYQIPDGVASRSRAHANFLFYLICQDHGVKSFRLYARAKALFVQAPSLFEPRAVLDHFGDDDGAQLANATGRALGTRFPNETARQWLQNSRKLLTEYCADARAIFTSSADSLEALERIRTFRGFGPKTSGLLFRTFYGVGFFKLPRMDEVPIPVDIHDTRIAFVSGLLRIIPAPDGITSDNYMQYAKTAQDAWMDVCRAGKMDWLALDRALWLLGSRGCEPQRYEVCCLKRNCQTRGVHDKAQGNLRFV